MLIAVLTQVAALKGPKRDRAGGNPIARAVLAF
jgi:hypothetical protein